MAAMSLQGFLITWLLVGVLHTPADRVGFGRALIEMPGLVILLIGGVLADRTDGRRLLIWMHLAIALPSLAIAAMVHSGLLSFWVVIAFGIAVSGLQAISDPARQSILSRVTRTDIQRTVTLMTIITSLAGLGGVWLGGQLDEIGLFVVLLLQAACFALGADAARRMPPMPPAPERGRPDLLAGIKAAWSIPLIRNIIGLNFMSSLVNAGAYIVAIPFIVKQVYRRRRHVLCDRDDGVYDRQHRLERDPAAIHAAVAARTPVSADATHARRHPGHALDRSRRCGCSMS